MKTYAVSSRVNPVIGRIKKIWDSPSREEFILQGEKFICDAEPSCIKELFTTDSKKYAELIARLGENAELCSVTSSVMEKLSGTESPSELLAVVRKSDVPVPERLMLLDGVQDPGNVGTIIRTAKAFGFGVICGFGCADPFSGKAVRSSAGAILTCYAEKASLPETVAELKASGYFVFGTALDRNSLRLENVVSGFSRKAAFVIGSEGGGVSREILTLCRDTVYIPIEGVESLNAAVAAGIIMYRCSSLFSG